MAGCEDNTLTNTLIQSRTLIPLEAIEATLAPSGWPDIT